MKKFLIALFIGLFSLCGHASEEPGVVLFEVGGQVYYIDDIELLQSLMESDSCINDGSSGSILELYKILYNSCRDGLADMVNSVVFSDNPQVGVPIKTARKTIDWIRDYKVRFALSEKNNLMSEDKKQQNMADALKGCLVEKDSLMRAMTEQQPTTKMKITADVNNCIRQIRVDASSVANHGNVCTTNLTIPDVKYIENMLDLNSAYQSKEFSFPVSGPFNQNKILVFNGNVMVACENGNPKYLIKPTYSGREQCQNGQYQNIPGFGGTPNGIYVVEKNYEPMPEDKQLGWGQYRAPLIPALETNTFGRTNMYLHGTTDPDKRRSGGCLSLGLQIDEFIETGFIDSTIPIIVNIDRVYQDDWLWPENKKPSYTYGRIGIEY